MSRSVTVPVLTIDGPSGSGKGTISRLVAEQLGWRLLDSGGGQPDQTTPATGPESRQEPDEGAKVGSDVGTDPEAAQGESGFPIGEVGNPIAALVAAGCVCCKATGQRMILTGAGMVCVDFDACLARRGATDEP